MLERFTAKPDLFTQILFEMVGKLEHSPVIQADHWKKRPLELLMK